RGAPASGRLRSPCIPPVPAQSRACRTRTGNRGRRRPARPRPRQRLRAPPPRSAPARAGARTSRGRPRRRSGRTRPGSYSLTMKELAAYRDQFPILEHTTYLINHSLGAMPAAAERRIKQYAHDWKTRGIRMWGEGWWELPLTVGDQIGRIIGAPPGTTTMHQNVTIAEAI